MKILVFAYKLVVSGTSVNAIELAAALRDLHGHEVVLFATPGPMLRLAQEKGLHFVPAPEARIFPSPSRVRALCETVRRERPDLIFAWDWPQSIEAYYSVHLTMRIPMVVTDMTMKVTRILPRGLPTTFGTPELLDEARAAGRSRVELLVPPVDVHSNAPGAVDPQPFRQQYGIDADGVTLVTVSRLDDWMKGESLVRTIDTVCSLGRRYPVRFVIVGDGTARPMLERLAEKTNAELGRRAVLLTGALVDPRPAYAAADVVVGMGGSALRGMAFGKPVIVVGEKGFAAPLTPDTAAFFNYKGIYGHGDGDPCNAFLSRHIRELVECPDRRRALGEFSREFVLRQFSLEAVSARLDKLCQGALDERPTLSASASDALRTAAVYLKERRFLTPTG